MKVTTMCDPVVLDIAAKYGIAIKGHDYKIPIAIPRRFQGPAYQGCDPKRRTLYFVESPYSDVEHYLHELVHVVVQTPWWSIKKTPEELLLLQFERSLAKSTLEDRAYKKVVRWQEETNVEIAGKYRSLGELSNYTSQPFWRMGYKICRRVGLLDAKNRPTYRWPDWSQIEEQKDALLAYIKSYGSTPLPKI